MFLERNRFSGQDHENQHRKEQQFVSIKKTGN